MVKLFSAALAASACLAAMPAAAATVLNWDSGDIGLARTVDFGGISNNAEVPGLTSQITYTLQSVAGSSWTFAYSVENTSSAPVTTSRVSGFGFDVDPNVSSASSTGVFAFPSSGNAPMIGSFELCFLASNGGQCAGGGGGGVTQGNTGTGTFTLNFAALYDSIALSNLFVRYQSLNAPDLGIAGASGVGQPTSPAPEPATWAMMIVGFASAGVLLRAERRRRGGLAIEGLAA